jgi:hypothetical protein
LTVSLAGVDEKLFVSTSLRSPAEGVPGRLALYTTVRADSGIDGDPMLPEWEAYLVAGAVAERLTGSGPINTALGWVVNTAVDPSGSVVDARGGAISPYLAGTRFPAAGLSDTEIASKLVKLTDVQGVRLSSVRVLHPLDPAVVVTVQLPEAATFTYDDYRKLDSAVSNLGSTEGGCAFEGSYLEIDSADGKPLARSAGTCRAGTGFAWTRSDSPFEIPHG